MTLIEASTPEEIEAIRTLFREYRDGTGSPECFTTFDEELLGLPGQYGSPAGRLLLAKDNVHWIGCVAFRPLDSSICELKRLYVRPSGRGLGLGQKLIAEAMKLAVHVGYERMRLDTLPQMRTAIELYRTMGFREIPPYTYNPVAGTLYFEVKL